MLLTRSQFDERLEGDNLRLALVGMSNIGKSHWARRFKSRHNFHHFEVDERIQENLSLSSISRSAKWMGQPYEERYAANAAEYLRLESAQTREADAVTGNIVLDTTGSVIYLGDEEIQQLSVGYLVIYLSARPDDLERLVKRFKSSPKPLIWGDHYRKRKGQSDEESLMSLYPSLLLKRDAMYRDMADIEIEARYIGNKTNLIELVRSHLPTGE